MYWSFSKGKGREWESGSQRAGLPEEKKGVPDEEEVGMKGTLGHLAEGTASTMAGRYRNYPEQVRKEFGVHGEKETESKE